MRRIRTTSVRASLLLILSCLFSSCTDLFQDEMMDVPCEVGFYAGGAETRTEMLSDGLSAVWVPGDEIAVWARSSSGAYVLSNQVFKTYGLDGSLGYFTSTLNSAMPSGSYTYFCCYPVPTSISGTTARFTIPSTVFIDVVASTQNIVGHNGVIYRVIKPALIGVFYAFTIGTRVVVFRPAVRVVNFVPVLV